MSFLYFSGKRDSALKCVVVSSPGEAAMVLQKPVHRRRSFRAPEKSLVYHRCAATSAKARRASTLLMRYLLVL